VMERSPRKAPPNASGADNGEIVPSTPQDVDGAIEDAQILEGRQRPGDDASGMRVASEDSDVRVDMRNLSDDVADRS
jgi:hypothetical protein